MNLSSGSIPSIAIMTAERSLNLYTVSALKHFCKMHGVPVVEDLKDAEFIWFSNCDPDDLKTLKEVREEYPEKPIIMGGFESYFGIPYLAWADYIVVGEGYNFIKQFSEDWEKALEMDNILTDIGQEVEPDYYVPWTKFPLVKIPGRNKYYYLAGKGCRRNCSFCATSSIQPHQEAPKTLIKRVLKNVEKQKWGKINLITNDSSRVYKSKAINAQSVRVEDYLKDPTRYKSNMLHFGIEGWTEEVRRGWKKPLKNSDIQQAINVTKNHGQQAEFFFIVGYNGWSMEDAQHFAEECIPSDTDTSPRIYVKVTYLDYVPHTPLENEEVNPNYCSPDEVFNIFAQYNQRFRVFPTRSMGRSAWRTVLRRCNPDEAIRLGRQPQDTNTPDSFKNFKAHLKDIGLEHRLWKPNKHYDNFKIKKHFRG